MTSKTNRDTCEHLFVPAYWRQAVPDYDRCTKCGLLDHYPKEPRMSREEAAKIVSEYAAKETRETREEEVSRLKSEHSLALEKVRKELEEVKAAGRAVMEDLAAYGTSIVPHLLDNDDNAGERLRRLCGLA